MHVPAEHEACKATCGDTLEEGTIAWTKPQWHQRDLKRSVTCHTYQKPTTHDLDDDRDEEAVGRLDVGQDSKAGIADKPP